MWAWRSLPNRPQSLLSRLQPVRRHASRRTAVLGSRNSSRGYASNNSNGDSAEVNRQHLAAKRHIYVVLDDSTDGFGIHKLDVDDNLGDDGAQRLPEPPLLRVAFPTVHKCAQFAAVGSSIVAVGTCRTMHLSEKDNAGVVFTYDTKTAGQVFSPQLPEGLLRDWDVYQAAITVGNRLYMISSSESGAGLHCLTADRGCKDDKVWNWMPLSLSYPWDKEKKQSSPWWWLNDELPFRSDYITAHAVRTPTGAAPHEREIFVSVWPSSPATFSFSTPRRETGRVGWKLPADGDITFTGGWTERGDWCMPIVGHAHYDAKLDMWLGLHDHDRYFCWPDGYLCAGNVTSDPSEWKVGKEKLCCRDEDAAAGWIHVDAKLVPMKSTNEAGTEYCLMERLEPDEGYDECLGDGVCLLRLTTFHVKSGENGEPVATPTRLARSYKVSRYNRYFKAQVFWM